MVKKRVIKKVKWVKVIGKEFSVDDKGKVLPQVILSEGVELELRSQVDLIFGLMPQESEKPSHLYNEGFNDCLRLCKVAVSAGLGIGAKKQV